MGVELVKKIDETIATIKQYTELIITGRYNLAKMYMPILSESLGVIPDIVTIYETEPFTEHREDQLYWINQLKRIIDTLERDDYFAQYDVLVNETVANLLIIKRMVDGVKI